MSVCQQKEFVILVDEHNRELGSMEKMEAHQKGVLHRAFSIFIYNSKGQWLLQQRAKNKYHSGGLWTNTCCSHPRLGETIINAANRRLLEEMGLEVFLTQAFQFIYKAKLDNNLIEHELDFVLFGKSDKQPALNTTEADNFEWLHPEEIKKRLTDTPEKYTEWFKIVFDKAYNYYKQNIIV
jgi:isopentenyl-diphosphate delta-isomerase